jgi:hypothetical protein
MSVIPVSSSTPLADWFASMGQLSHIVQQQSQLIQQLQTRIAVLETHARIIPVFPTPVPVPVPAPQPKKPRKVKEGETKKRGRKVDADLSFLREGEQVIARIPLGDRRFDEHAVLVRENKLVLEDGQIFDHPTTLVAAIAKMLEDIGERSTECSKSLNGWILCTVTRDGKRVPLEKLKPADVTAEISEITAEVAEVAEAI